MWSCSHSDRLPYAEKVLLNPLVFQWNWQENDPKIEESTVFIFSWQSKLW
jgi:hypothetical protein